MCAEGRENRGKRGGRRREGSREKKGGQGQELGCVGRAHLRCGWEKRSHVGDEGKEAGIVADPWVVPSKAYVAPPWAQVDPARA